MTTLALKVDVDDSALGRLKSSVRDLSTSFKSLSTEVGRSGTDAAKASLQQTETSLKAVRSATQSLSRSAKQVTDDYAKGFNSLLPVLDKIAGNLDRVATSMDRLAQRNTRSMQQQKQATEEVARATTQLSQAERARADAEVQNAQKVAAAKGRSARSLSATDPVSGYSYRYTEKVSADDALERINQLRSEKQTRQYMSRVIKLNEDFNRALYRLGQARQKQMEDEAARKQAHFIKMERAETQYMVGSARRQAQMALNAAIDLKAGKGIDEVRAAYGMSAVSRAQKASVDDLRQSLVKLSGAKVTAVDGTKKFTEASHALHSALRGVGGGMDHLWLTYGKYASVMAGMYAVTKTFRDSVSRGISADFEAQFVSVVQTQGEASGALQTELKNYIRDGLIDVSRQSVFTVNENAEALKKLSLAGVRATDGLKLLTTASNAAVFGQLELGDATSKVLDTLNNFALFTDEPDKLATNFTRVADVMAYTATTVNASFADIARSFENVTGVAGTFNIQIEEASVLLQSLAKAGVRGPKAGTYLRNFLDDLLGAPISSNADQALKSLGMPRFDAESFEAGEYGVSEYIDKLVNKLKTLDFVTQQNTIRTISNARSRRVLRQELQQDVSLVERTQALAAKADGSLAKLAGALTDNAKYSILMAQAAYDAATTQAFAGNENYFKQIGADLQTLFKSDLFNEFLTEGVRAIGSIAESMTTLLKTVVEYKEVFYAAFDVAKGVLIAAGLAKAFSLITSAVQGLTNAYRLAQAARMSLAAAEASANAGVPTRAAAQRIAAGSQAFRLAGPVGNVVATAVGIGATAYMMADNGVTEEEARIQRLRELVDERDALLEKLNTPYHSKTSNGFLGVSIDTRDATEVEGALVTVNQSIDELQRTAGMATAELDKYLQGLKDQGASTEEAVKAQRQLEKAIHATTKAMQLGSEEMTKLLASQEAELMKLDQSRDAFSEQNLKERLSGLYDTALQFSDAVVQVESALKASKGEGDFSNLVTALTMYKEVWVQVQNEIDNTRTALTNYAEIDLRKRLEQTDEIIKKAQDEYEIAGMNAEQLRQHRYEAELHAISLLRYQAEFATLQANLSIDDADIAEQRRKAELYTDLANRLATSAAYTYSTPDKPKGRPDREPARERLEAVRTALQEMKNAQQEATNAIASNFDDLVVGPMEAYRQKIDAISSSYAQMQAAIDKTKSDPALQGSDRQKLETESKKLEGERLKALRAAEQELSRILKDRADKIQNLEVETGKRVLSAQEVWLQKYVSQYGDLATALQMDAQAVQSQIAEHVQTIVKETDPKRLEAARQELARLAPVAAQLEEELYRLTDAARFGAWAEGVKEALEAAGVELEGLQRRLSDAGKASEEGGIFGTFFGTAKEFEKARRQTVEQLRRTLDYARGELAKAGDTKVKLQIEAEISKIESSLLEAEKAVDPVLARWGDTLGDYIANGIVYGFDQGESPAKAFANMLKRELYTAIAQALSSEFKMLLNVAFGGGGGGGSVGGSSGGFSLSSLSNLSSLWNAGSSLVGTAYGSYAASGLAYGTAPLSQQSMMLAAQDYGLYGGSLSSPMASTGFAQTAGKIAPGLAAYGFGQKYGVVGGLAGGVGSAALAGGVGGLMSGAGFMSGAGAALAGLGPLGWAAIGVGAILGGVMGNKKPSDKTAWANVDPTTGMVSGIGSMTGKKDPGQEARDQTAALAQMIGQFAGLAGITSSITAMTGGRDGTRLKINRSEGTLGFRTPGAGIANGGNALNYGYGEEALRRMLNDLVDEGTLPQATINAWRTLQTDARGAARDAEELISTLRLTVAGYSNLEVQRADLIQQEGEALEAALGRVLTIRRALDTSALPGEDLAKAASEFVRQVQALGVAVPKTGDDFLKLVDGLDISSTSGQNLYASLMALAPAFTELQTTQRSLYDQLLSDEELAKRGTDALAAAFKKLGVAAPQSASALRSLIDSQDATTEAGAALKAQLLALVPAFVELTRSTEETRLAAIDLARTNLEKAYQAERQELEKTQNSLEQFIDSVRKARDNLQFSDLSVLDGVTRYAVAKQQLDNDTLAAANGDTDAQSRLVESAQRFLQESRGLYASGEAYTADYQKVMDILAAAESSAGFGLTEAEQSLKLLESQVSALIDINDSVLSVRDAILALQRAEAMPTIPQFASGGLHTGGGRIVGERGPELEVTGPARYWSFDKTREVFGGGANNDALVSEVRALRAEVAGLRRQQAEEHREAVESNFEANDRAASKIAEKQEQNARRDRAAMRYA